MVVWGPFYLHPDFLHLPLMAARRVGRAGPTRAARERFRWMSIPDTRLQIEAEEQHIQHLQQEGQRNGAVNVRGIELAQERITRFQQRIEREDRQGLR